MRGRNWTALIEDLVEGRWLNPLNGRVHPRLPFGRIAIEEDLAGREAELVGSVGLEPPYIVVSDTNTHRAMGARIAGALAARGPVREIVLEDPHCDMATVVALEARLPGAGSVVAVGSGTVNDLTKFATHRQGRPYCVFATAPSMNGYGSVTASVTLESGLKVSLPAQMPLGVFIDLTVCAQAPAFLRAAGFGDSLCRSVAQVDWWMSHRLLGTVYRHEPYIIEIPEEAKLLAQAEALARGEIEAVGTLVRVLMLEGMGVSFTGGSHHGSMGEHQISHYLDCFAGDGHPGTLHGHQVGVATLTMARIQGHFLERQEPPALGPTRIDAADMERRMGGEIAGLCLAELRKKALDAEAAERLSVRLAEIWPALREECLAMFVPAARLAERLAAAGGQTTAEGLGFAPETYREAVCHAHEMRNRFSFADIADLTGALPHLAAAER